MSRLVQAETERFRSRMPGASAAAGLDPPAEVGPPWTHTFRPPAPVEEPVEGEDGGMVLVATIPLARALTVRPRPTFTGCLAYLANGVGTG